MGQRDLDRRACRRRCQDYGWCVHCAAFCSVEKRGRYCAGEAFPADLLLLQSSAQQGICNIETSNLDGCACGWEHAWRRACVRVVCRETNLKIKQGVPELYEIKCGQDGLDYPEKIQGAHALAWRAPLRDLET